jgi:L-alanine-DL-glutamate epimerase-like enolase superfamily enzyme
LPYQRAQLGHGKKWRAKIGMQIDVVERVFRMREPFAISRGTKDDAPTVQVAVQNSNGHVGRGEAAGVNYHGETTASMIAQIEAIRPALEEGVSRAELLKLLPAGGARNAVDCALWDLDAKQNERTVFGMVGIKAPVPLCTAYTIGIRSLEGYERAAREHADFKTLKIKVGASDPLSAIKAVRRGAPQSRFIVDPNMSWSADDLKRLAPELMALGVVLLEQPIKIGDERHLQGFRCPVPLCADELVRDVADLEKAAGVFSVVNIKLDKSGGLTCALELQKAAIAAGFETMVGCMSGSSLAMAPAIVIGQKCRFVDLDGPLLLAEDMPGGLTYHSGVVSPPDPSFWG